MENQDKYYTIVRDYDGKETARVHTGMLAKSITLENMAQILQDFVNSGMKDMREGEALLAEALPLLEQAAGAEVEGRVASSPNAYDDIVAELNLRHYSEIILETVPSHVSHWLHVDLPERIALLGYPLTTVTATH